MQLDAAYRTFFKFNKSAQKTLNRIKDWDSDKTALDNAFELVDGEENTARIFAWRYGLRASKKVYTRNCRAYSKRRRK